MSSLEMVVARPSLKALSGYENRLKCLLQPATHGCIDSGGRCGIETQ